MPAKINKPGLAALAFGHLAIDMQTSSLAIMIPLLLLHFKLDYAAAALIITVNSITSYALQPFFGLLSDRKPLPWLLPLGCLLAAGGMVSVLFMPSYPLVLLAVIVSGMGAAIYHPEGSRNANYVSGANKATAMSLFFFSGNLGQALGPITLTILLGLAGTNGSLGMLLPGLVGFGLLWLLLPLYRGLAQARRARPVIKTNPAPGHRRTLLGLLAMLLSIISLRAMIQTGLLTFIPLYFATLPDYNKGYVATLLSVFVLAGAVGTLSGGPLADRFGQKNVMVGSLALVLPLLLVFLNTQGAIQMISLGLAGTTLTAASSLTVVMAQDTLPNSIGLATGLTLGLGFGAGGLGTSALGKYADSFGLSQAMLILVLLPIPIVLLSLWLPSKRVAGQQSQATPVELTAPTTEGSKA